MKPESDEKEWGHWGYENDQNAEVWRYACFTESGAYTLAKTMKKMGCTIIEKPTMRDDGLWMFAFSNPLHAMARAREAGRT